MAEQPPQSGKSPGTDCAGSETVESLIGSTKSVGGILTSPVELAPHAACTDDGGDRIKQHKSKLRFGLAISGQCSSWWTCRATVESLSQFSVGAVADVRSRQLERVRGKQFSHIRAGRSLWKQRRRGSVYPRSNGRNR